ncbi:hypothetical protein Dxin01_03163 [Deinococcus xinjiangensis]|uniref:Uncharacterized protein n=1 Tax=Deinococcus xinjiangensis TaxID=457454 RepID=A0ABP9VFI8_9DEIO
MDEPGEGFMSLYVELLDNPTSCYRRTNSDDNLYLMTIGQPVNIA